jgi:porin-like protein
MGPYDISGNRIQADTAGGGINGIAYTAQLGNGISASVSLEDPGQLIYGRGEYIVNTSVATYGLTQGGFGAPAGDNSIVFWDPVASLRIDQAWGFAQISGAAHNDSGGYYGGTLFGSPTAGISAGHPNDVWGWATSAGFTLNNFLGFRGDTAGMQGSYCVGAAGYCNMSQLSSLLLGGGKIDYVNGIDGTYNLFTNGGQISLATQWSFTAFWEHYWDPKWRTSFFGGIAGYDYTAANVASICPVGFGGTPGAVGATGTWSQMAWLPGSTCNPNYNTWQIGTRTMWNPHPYLDIGVEVIYTQLNQSNTGAAIVNTTGGAGPAGAPGAISPTLYNFASGGVWAGFFRIQRNFLY